MRAFTLLGPGRGAVEEVDPPVAGPGGAVVAVERVGLCGTDAEFFSGEMAYLHSGEASYPLRIGHEWAGTVVAVGPGVDPGWIGRRTTGDTMLGCGTCARCRTGRAHLCAERFEVGIRRGFPGALAERLAVPASSLKPLPDGVDSAAGALVEPGANAYRAVRAAAVRPGGRLLILGAGTIGLLAALLAAADGTEVHLVGRSARSLAFAAGLPLGDHLGGVWTAADLPDLPFDAVIDASNGADLPALAVERVEPGGRVVLIGLSGTPSTLDTRRLALKDVTAVGILSGSPGLDPTIERYASGAVDPRPLVAATVGLADVAAVLAGERPSHASPAPKVQVDPHR